MKKLFRFLIPLVFLAASHLSLGDVIKDKDDFAGYIRALKAHDFAELRKYFTDDYKGYFLGRVVDVEGAIENERILADSYLQSNPTKPLFKSSPHMLDSGF